MELRVGVVRSWSESESIKLTVTVHEHVQDPKAGACADRVVHNMRARSQTQTMQSARLEELQAILSFVDDALAETSVLADRGLDELAEHVRRAQPPLVDDAAAFLNYVSMLSGLLAARPRPPPGFDLDLDT